MFSTLLAVAVLFGATPSPTSRSAVEQNPVTVFTADTPGFIITRRPLGHANETARAAVTEYDGSAVASPSTIPASSALGFEDYGTPGASSGPPTLAPARHELIALHTFAFVGGTTSGNLLFFDFFQNDGSLITSFGVSFPSTGLGIWSFTITDPALVPIPAEGILQIRGNTDPALGPITQGQWVLTTSPPSPGYNDVTYGGDGVSRYFAFRLEVETALPSCPPAGAPYTLKTYHVVGNANNTPWAWKLQPKPLPGQWLQAVDGDVPGVPAGGALSVATAFAASVNAYATTQGCPAANLQAQAVSVPPDALLVIRVGASADFDLYVGPANDTPTLLVPVSPASVTFNPDISLLPLSGNDCNDNFQDDETDIALGLSADVNANGIPDECESPPPGCPGDLNLDDRTDVFDFTIFAAGFGSSGLPPFTGGDLDGDGAVNVFDFAIFAADFGCAP